MWDWIHKVQSLKKQNEAFVLVTVVKCLGSTPRNIGARMIVSKKNHIFGTIGGGNLEQQAREDALKYLKESQNKVSQYPLCAKSQQCCGGEVELMYEILISLYQ